MTPSRAFCENTPIHNVNKVVLIQPQLQPKYLSDSQPEGIFLPTLFLALLDSLSFLQSRPSIMELIALPEEFMGSVYTQRVVRLKEVKDAGVTAEKFKSFTVGIHDET